MHYDRMWEELKSRLKEVLPDVDSQMGWPSRSSFAREILELMEEIQNK